jgi:hypothetical protein
MTGKIAIILMIEICLPVKAPIGVTRLIKNNTTRQSQAWPAQWQF